jgi:dGTPase
VVPDAAQLGGRSEKKYGHFQTESARFQHVAPSWACCPSTRPSGFYHRHPLAFLVEAADDCATASSTSKTA